MAISRVERPLHNRAVGVLLFAMFIAGAFLTSWAEQVELDVLMPLRNLIVLGQSRAFSTSKIGVTKYSNGEQGINPVQVAQMVRGLAITILDNSTRETKITAPERARLLEVADFLISYGESGAVGSVHFKLWPYKFDYPYYGIKKPWYSAMAQGHVIEVMLAAYRVTDDHQYLEEAQLAANALYVSVSDGGVSTRVDGGVWFEEYASSTAPSPFVLNGHNYTLNALWFLSKLDPRYEDLFAKGVAAERSMLNRYDANVWTRYDLAGTIADGHYQRVHIQQLGDLYTRTGDEFFLRMKHRLQWQLFLPGGVIYRLVRVHNTFLLLLYGINVAVCLAVALGVRKVLRWTRPRQALNIRHTSIQGER